MITPPRSPDPITRATDLRIVFVNIHQRFAVVADGRSFPVTNLIDAYGDETSDPDEAVAFVAGAGREWISEPLSGFREAVLH